MASIVRHVASASTVLLPLLCGRASGQSVQALAAAAPTAALVSLDAFAPRFASSFEERVEENISGIRLDTFVAEPQTKSVVVRYDAAVVDSHAKTARKARDLAVMPGVRNASALTCVGVVVVSCHSEELQRQLVDDLASDPHVESARHVDAEMGRCGAADFEFPTSLQLVSAKAVANDSARQASTHVESFVQGSLTVSGLDVEVAKGMLQVWQHLFAASLPNTTEDSIDILSVVPWPLSGQMGYAASRDKAKKGRPRSLRSQSTKVEYKVVAPRGSPSDFLDEIEAHMKLLHQGGRSTERFDAALDAELAGLQVVLPDWAKSHFALPRRGASDELKLRGPASDQDSVACILAFLLMFFILAPVLGISTMLCLFNSSVGYGDSFS